MAVLILGLAAGLTALAFGVINAVLVHPLPVREAERLYIASGLALPEGYSDPIRFWFRSGVFEDLSVYSTGLIAYGASATGNGNHLRVHAAVVSGNFFTTLTVKPTRGRLFSRADESTGEEAAIITDEFRQSVLGRTGDLGEEWIELGGRRHRVVGTIANRQAYPPATSIWVVQEPRALALQGTSTLGSFRMTSAANLMWMGRLKPNLSRAAAHARLSAMLAAENSAQIARTGVHLGELVALTSLGDSVTRADRNALLALFGASCAILVTANFASALLFMGIGLTRQSEMAARMALGATHGRLLRQLTTEASATGLLVFLVASVAATSLTAALRNLTGLDWLLSGERLLTTETVLFSAGAAILSSLVPGLAPASYIERRSLGAAMQDSTASFGPLRGHATRRLLVVSALAVACVTTALAEISAYAFIRLTTSDTGFRRNGVVAVDLAIPPAVAKQKSTAGALSLYLARITGLPGVQSASATSRIPVIDSAATHLYLWKGVLSIGATNFTVGADYFDTLDIPIRTGRTFSLADAHSIVINETLAHRLWGASSPIGDRIRLDGEDQERVIVGVVADVKSASVNEAPEAQFYLPFQSPYRGITATSVTVVAYCGDRCDGALRYLRTPSERAALHAEASEPYMLKDELANVMKSERIGATAFGMFGVAGTLLSALSVYCLVSFVCGMRGKEIAVRQVLGATKIEITAEMAREEIVYGVAGLVLGSATIVAALRPLADSTWFAVGIDPRLLVLSFAVLTVVTVTAALLPVAFRVTREDFAVLRQPG